MRKVIRLYGMGHPSSGLFLLYGCLMIVEGLLLLPCFFTVIVPILVCDNTSVQMAATMLSLSVLVSRLLCIGYN